MNYHRCRDGILVANSLITLMEEKDIKKISFNKYLRYQVKLIQQANQDGKFTLVVFPHQHGIENDFVKKSEHAKFFSSNVKSGKIIISVNEGVTVEQLKIKYQNNLPEEIIDLLNETKDELLTIVDKNHIPTKKEHNV